LTQHLSNGGKKLYLITKKVMTGKAPEAAITGNAAEYPSREDAGIAKDWRAENSLGNSIKFGATSAENQSAQIRQNESQFDFAGALSRENVLELFKGDSLKGKPENILPGKLPEKLPFPLYGMDISRQTLEEIRQEIRENGKDPKAVVPETMKNVRVLAIGESHQPNNQHRRFGAQIMEKLKESGATHLALELQKQYQPDIDQFLQTGKFEEDFLSSPDMGEEYTDILRAARKAGIKIVAVDKDRSGGGGGGGGSDSATYSPPETETPEETDKRSRDEVMTDEIGKILDADPKNKVVFWVGGNHLSRTPGDYTGSATLLAQKYKIATILPQSDLSFTDTLVGITRDITKPTMIDLTKSQKTGDFKQGSTDLASNYRDWDYTIIYPQMKDQSGKPLIPLLQKEDSQPVSRP